MSRLIKLQMRNVLKSKFFYVCLILSILNNVAFTFIFGLFLGGDKPLAMAEIMSMFKSELSVISVVFLVLFACFDFNEGTTKNIIGRGYSRTQLLLSKYIVGLISIFFMIFIMTVLCFIFYTANGIGFQNVMILKLINNVFDITAHVIFFVTIAFLLEKHSSAIIACILVPNMLPLLFLLIESNYKIKISKLWLDGVSTKFLSQPNWGTLGWTILFYSIYIIIFILIGVSATKRKEIK